MKAGFRQRMSGLHTWCGLVAGWLLCAILLTGTLSVWRQPITLWMQARPAVPSAPAAAAPAAAASAAAASAAAAPAAASSAALRAAAGYLAVHAEGARFWRIELPQRSGDALLLAWPASGGDGMQAMDPATGALLPMPWGRETQGGRHFMSFHYALHGGMAGFWVVGWVTMCMLVALVSGVAVHRRIFADFFTFRPGKGQRSWLDAHNATAVLTLPFLFMIAYTGLSIFYTSYMPWPLQAAYATDANGANDAYARMQSELSAGEAAPLPRPRTGTAAALHDLAPMLQQVRDLGASAPWMVVVEQPGDAAMLVRVHGTAPQDGPGLLMHAPQASFDGATGALLQAQLAGGGKSASPVHGVLNALHLVTFGGWTMKWLYFASGLMGTAMVATGTVLFSVKRRKKSAMEFGACTPPIYRAIEVLNIAAVAGIALACIAYFWVNRLLPASLADRQHWEIRGFFGVWLATLAHAALRPAARAWLEQLACAALLCLLLPLLNLCTTGQHLGVYALAGDWQRAGVELAALALGLALSAMAWHVWRGGQAPMAKARA
ncbi:PepSY-associated TM helix domain-containing protein [Delftia sp. PS-11]|uniref:PepSY-associated TM helix domain-containing protein n=1 Tax=Delftia sp. PS-11 TaxID=2767222 RepID=UPI00245550EE|nr:PepSY-associated TM helix domain-containing protein [Delftia sp. PS-11]